MQFDFGDLESPLSGSNFINANLEPWRDALHTLHKGPSTPSYAVAGMMWIDDSGSPWVLNIFDGTDNISVGTVDPTTNAFTPSGVSQAAADITVNNSGFNVFTGDDVQEVLGEVDTLADSLGTAAFEDVGAFATAAQGALADTALQPGDGGVPVGTTIEFNGTTPPSGYLEENGALISRTTYAALFAAIGTTHGVGDGTTTFAIPDSRRRTAIGAGGAGTGTIGNAVGNKGGVETVALTGDQNGPHTHGVGIVGASGSTYRIFSTSLTSNVTTYIQTQSSGLGTGHENMPPSIVKMKCIKY